MPKEIKDLKEFINIFRRENKSLPVAEKITIKKNKKTTITKFKLRTPKYLYTLKVDDTTKAEKIMQSIPPNLKKEQLNVNSKWEAGLRFNAERVLHWAQRYRASPEQWRKQSDLLMLEA